MVILIQKTLKETNSEFNIFDLLDTQKNTHKYTNMEDITAKMHI